MRPRLKPIRPMENKRPNSIRVDLPFRAERRRYEAHDCEVKPVEGRHGKAEGDNGHLPNG